MTSDPITLALAHTIEPVPAEPADSIGLALLVSLTWGWIIVRCLT